MSYHQRDLVLVNRVVMAAREVIRERVLEFFSDNSCIATTRITLDTLSYFSIAAKPVGVEVPIYNDAAVKMIRAGNTLEEVRTEVFRYSPTDIGGPWTLGLGVREPNGGEGGHMAAWIPGTDLFLDFSLDQASRPNKGLLFEPAVFKIPNIDESVRDSDTLPVGFSFPVSVPQPAPYGPARLEYRVVKDWFRGSPNWRRTSTNFNASTVFRRVTGDAIREIRRLIS